MKDKKQKKKVKKAQWCQNTICGKKITGEVSYSHGRIYCNNCFNKMHGWAGTRGKPIKMFSIFGEIDENDS